MSDVAIVGAGPAGLSAAYYLASRGVSFDIFSSLPTLGGQIARRPIGQPITKHDRWSKAGSIEDANEFIKTLSPIIGNVLGFEDPVRNPTSDGLGTGLTVESDRAERVVWWADTEGVPHSSRFNAVIIATGAYDMYVPIPGAELANVLGIGGLESLLKSHALPERSRLALFGSHPLTLITAGLLLLKGHTVVRLELDLPHIAGLDASVSSALVAARKSPELFNAIKQIARGRTLIHRGGQGPRHIHATDEGLAVETRDGVVIDCDYVGLGYGFTSNSALARQAGCTTQFDFAAGGWVVVHDRQRTNQKDVYVAGEITGVAGAEASAAEGRLAAMVAGADHLGIAPSRSELSEAARGVRRWNRFGMALTRATTITQGGLVSVLSDNSVVCRCENVSYSTIREDWVIRESVGLRGIKLGTRVGMGPCQARMCGPLLASLAEGRHMATSGLTPRFPIELLESLSEKSDQVEE